MNRRLFLQFPLVAASLTLEAQNKVSERIDKPLKVEAGKDRFDAGVEFMGGKFDLKVSSKDTDGDLCIYDTVRTQKGGPPLHFHHSQDEWFHVKDGEFLFKIGDETFNLKAGDSIFGPRKIPHAFAKISEGNAKLMIIYQPAGTMEEFFLEASRNPNMTHDESQELHRKHGLEVVGPPLKVN